jgi:hypothetical protein
VERLRSWGSIREVRNLSGIESAAVGRECCSGRLCPCAAQTIAHACVNLELTRPISISGLESLRGERLKLHKAPYRTDMMRGLESGALLKMPLKIPIRGWLEHEVQEWIARRIAASRQAAR